MAAINAVTLIGRMSSLDEYELKYEKPRRHRFNTKANRTKLAKAKEQEKQLKKGEANENFKN